MSTVDETALGLTAERLDSIGKRARVMFGPGPRRFRWTREKYMKLAERGFFRNKRVELIHGEIIEMSPVGTWHATSVALTYRILEAIFGPVDHVRVQQQHDLGVGEQPEPDLAVVRGSPRDYMSEHPTTALLIVEVSESSIRIDLGEKAGLYAKAGIADYWVVNLVNRTLVVHRQPESDPSHPGKFHYTEVTVVPADGFVSPLAKPDARIAVADLLP